jgi:hypothetical protein
MSTVLEIADHAANGDFAAILHPAQTTSIKPRSILIWHDDARQPTFIPIFSRHYEPLQYPLLFPNGTPGWGLKDTPDGKPARAVPFTQRQWYKGRLLTDNRFLQFGRLTCEYLCDMYSRIEEERLNYIYLSRANQAQPTGNINLPASFLGSRKWTSEQTADALALARRYGHPSLFITMTCNPQWPEIQNRLRPSQTYNEVPLIVVRAFKVRLQRLIKILRKNFGGSIYIIKIIEFQKRGLPHAHIVIKVRSLVPLHLRTLFNHPKLKDDIPVEHIDKIISAELPTHNPALRRKIVRYMTHGRDHLTRENSRCQKDGKCIYGFPHPLTSKTWVDEDGRVHYKRTSEEDRWIAPHIPELVDELECHIFVDVVFTSSVFTYLYKYLYKGVDKTYYALPLPTNENQAHNEIHDYIQARYLSSMECAWRIMGFNITTKEPSVQSISFHLPGQDVHKLSVKEHRSPSASPLIRYFHRPPSTEEHDFENQNIIQYYENYVLYNPDHPPVSGVYFEEMPIEDAQQFLVSPRQHGTKTCRLQIISPTAGEVFYLRALLIRSACRSFEGARTVHGVVYDTFHEAALEMGLFADENEGMLTMTEAASCFQTPAQLRFLFERLILEGYPAQPLWENFQEALAQDDIHTFRSQDLGINRTLQRISEFLQENDRTLSDFGLPEATVISTEVLAEKVAFEPRQLQLQRDTAKKHKQLVDEQKRFYDVVSDIADRYTRDNYSSGPIFLEGKPGRGKTFVIDCVVCNLRSQKKIAIVVGTTALAATLYERGRTAHNMFRVPVNDVSPSP